MNSFERTTLKQPVFRACAEDGDEDGDEDEPDVGEEEAEDGLAELSALPPTALHVLVIPTLLLYFPVPGGFISRVRNLGNFE